jgi:hypothetical protein
MKILAIGCICLCAVVIAYVLKIYFESPKMKLPEEEKKKYRL